jgi:hypothetical protein
VPCQLPAAHASSSRLWAQALLVLASVFRRFDLKTQRRDHSRFRRVRGGSGAGGGGASCSIQGPSWSLVAAGNPILIAANDSRRGAAWLSSLRSPCLRVSLKAPNQGSAKCQRSLVILQSHAIRPRFATSKTRGCYLMPMRAPSRASCLPTEVSEERDDGIESAAFSLSRRMHSRLSVRGFQGARKAN